MLLLLLVLFFAEKPMNWNRAESIAAYRRKYKCICVYTLCMYCIFAALKMSTSCVNTATWSLSLSLCVSPSHRLTGSQNRKIFPCVNSHTLTSNEIHTQKSLCIHHGKKERYNSTRQTRAMETKCISLSLSHSRTIKIMKQREYLCKCVSKCLSLFDKMFASQRIAAAGWIRMALLLFSHSAA